MCFAPDALINSRGDDFTKVSDAALSEQISESHTAVSLDVCFTESKIVGL